MPPHASVTAFGDSEQARLMAATQAEELINQFCIDLKLSGEARTRRRLDFNKETAVAQAVPRAYTNRDRGKWPLWHYINESVNSFHANVPNMQDVYGAILRSPWRLAHIWCTIFSEYPEGAERDKWIDAFLEDAVADSCFNQKWKSIEEFSEQLGKVGTVVHRLQQLQKQHQAEFAEIFDDRELSQEEQDQAEASKLAEICQKHGETARDKHGAIRDITMEDCVAFVRDPSSIL